MKRVPFKRFIVAFLLFSKQVAYIREKVQKFGYDVTDLIISDIFTELKSTLPEKYKEALDKKLLFNLNDEFTVEWLKQFKIFEFYDYVIRQDKKMDEPPPYFKWFRDCFWIHGYKDAMCLVNILLFNGDSFEEISNVISFKFKKKVSVDALQLYQNIFWDTEGISAKEALYYCTPFRHNTLIVRSLRGGSTEFESMRAAAGDEQSDGSDVPFTFHDTKYIKWKIGYRDVSVPSSSDFLEHVKKDSFFKYYEAMNMTRSVEIEDEEGANDKLGAFNSIKTKKRNVEEQRVKMAKSWVDLYVKADKAKPPESGDKSNFFDKMEQLELEFGEVEAEKIASVEDIPDMMDQIKGDMSGM